MSQPPENVLKFPPRNTCQPRSLLSQIEAHLDELHSKGVQAGLVACVVWQEEDGNRYRVCHSPMPGEMVFYAGEFIKGDVVRGTEEN